MLKLFVASVEKMSVNVIWLDEGPSEGKISSVARRFNIDEGELEDGQDIRIQMSRRKDSKAKIWNAKVVKLVDDNRAREPGKKKKDTKEIAKNTKPPRLRDPDMLLHLLSHIRKSMEKQQADDFCFSTENPAPPVIISPKNTLVSTSESEC